MSTVATSFASLGYTENDFTAGEREVISRRVGELTKDGESEADALAHAIKECAPSKAAVKASIGGNYEWSRNTDGTYNIFDIPVFAKHVRKLGMRMVADAEGNPKIEEVTINVDEKWLSRAIELNRRRYDQEQYLGPLHVRHHPKGDEGADTTEPAGHFLLKYVKAVPFEGEVVPMLYADFLRIPEGVFNRIKQGQLSYRSIESLPPQFEEIDSIALLDTDVPWFRLPMLTPGKEIQREVYRAVDATSPFRGYARSGVRWAALFYQAGEGFKEREDDEKKSDKGDSDNEKKTAPASGDDKGSMNSEAEDGLTDDMSDDQIEQSLGGDTMSKILEALQALAKTQEAILAKMGGAAQPPAPVTPGAPAAESGPGKSAAQFDAAEGAALKAIVYGMKAEKDITEKVNAACERLVEYNLGPTAKKDLLDEALKSSDPERVISTFVATVEKHGTKMPTPVWSTARPSGSPPLPPPGANVPDEIRAYFAKSPELGQRALAAWNGYDEALKMGVIHKSMSRQDFVKFNLTKDYSALLAG